MSPKQGVKSSLHSFKAIFTNLAVYQSWNTASKKKSLKRAFKSIYERNCIIRRGRLFRKSKWKKCSQYRKTFFVEYVDIARSVSWGITLLCRFSKNLCSTTQMTSRAPAWTPSSRALLSTHGRSPQIVAWVSATVTPCPTHPTSSALWRTTWTVSVVSTDNDTHLKLNACLNLRVAVISAKNHKRQSVTAKREKSQTPKVLTAILTVPNLT